MKVIKHLLVFVLSIILSITLLFVAGMSLEWRSGAYFSSELTVAKTSFKQLNTASTHYQTSELLSECCPDLPSMGPIEIASDELPEITVSGGENKHRDDALDFTDLSVYIAYSQIKCNTLLLEDFIGCSVV